MNAEYNVCPVCNSVDIIECNMKMQTVVFSPF